MNKELKPCPFCGGEMEPTVMCYQHPYDQTMKVGGGSAVAYAWFIWKGL